MRSLICAFGLSIFGLIGSAAADGAVKRSTEFFGKPWLGQPEKWGEATARLIASGDLEFARDVLSGRTRRIANATGFLDILTASGDANGCTAALISDRLLLTAAHCVPETGSERPSKIIFMLGYETAPPEDDDDIRYFEVERTPVERGSETGVDYAILKLRKPIRNVDPIKALVSEPEPGQKLTILAHPGGSPLLITQQNCRTKPRRPANELSILHECVTAEGSSGALVFDDDWRIVGLHSRAVHQTKYAIRVAALLDASPTLNGMFSYEGDRRNPCPENLPENIRCFLDQNDQAQFEVAADNSPSDKVAQAEVAYRRGDFRRAFTLLEPLAEDGSAVALFWLGRLYNRGEGTETNRVMAYSLWRSGAARGSQRSATALASLAARLSLAELSLAERFHSERLRKLADQR